MAGYWARGVLLGFGGWLLWRRMRTRKAAKGEYSSPGFRCLALLVLPPVIGFALSMSWIPETGWLTGGGCLLGLALATVYAVYRASGGGRLNSRRAGSPWRADHRRR